MKDTPPRRHPLPVLWRSLRATGLQRLLLAVGYGASILMTVFIVWMIIAQPGTAPLPQTSRFLFILVAVNFALVLTLIYFVLHRVIKIARSRGADAGARLHLRFVFLFSVAAVAPAIVIGSSFLFINRGVDNWLSGRVLSAVKNGFEIALVAQQDNINSAGTSMNYIEQALQSEGA
ncbi:MAG TPA: PAS domain-containing sensor histidine kinase, partial [Asticcacaulis sp.]|nr:PAS domain-containing sensor histidine kinase [Asticcacaulis sp.]